VASQSKSNSRCAASTSGLRAERCGRKSARAAAQRVQELKELKRRPGDRRFNSSPTADKDGWVGAWHVLVRPLQPSREGKMSLGSGRD